MVETVGDPGLFPVIAAIFAVGLLLTLFILPDYICWKRRLRQLPSITAHQIQFTHRETAEIALNTIRKEEESKQFDKFCEISRAMTKSKENRAGSDGLIFGGRFQVGEMPDEYSSLERELFAYNTPVDTPIGPYQTHVDAFHIAYITDRQDPVRDKQRELEAKAEGKPVSATTTTTTEPKKEK
jgi:hypothetical protein